MACALSSRKSCQLPDDWLTSSKLSIETSKNGCAECNTFPLPSRVVLHRSTSPHQSSPFRRFATDEIHERWRGLASDHLSGLENGRREAGTRHYHRHDTSSARRLLPISFARGHARGAQRARSEKSSSTKAAPKYVPCVSDFIISVGGTCTARRAHAAQERGELNLMRGIDELGRRPGFVRTVNGQRSRRWMNFARDRGASWRTIFVTGSSSELWSPRDNVYRE